MTGEPADMTEKMNKLAKDVLLLSRNTLLVNLRFLDMALSQFELFPIDTSTMLTDAKYILYNPRHILENYKTAKEIPVRDYLHLVMHCIFRHMYMDPSLNRPYWDLACDIAVENMITELNLKAVTTARERQQAQYISAIKKELKYVTAEKIYSYLRQTIPDPKKIAEIRGLFYADNHEIWYMTAEEIRATFGIGSAGSSGDDLGEDGGDDQGDGNGSGADATTEVGISAAMSEVWQSISERMQVDLETFGKQRGINPGAMTQNLAAVNREKYDYTAFLKKFAVMGEAMKINDDEFDYIFYTYGLQLYEKMPLIEPLEYKEIKAIKEFVIAIDTSGSTSGELVQKFVQKTYNILKSTESFFSKINLHIIQCDADIQEDKKITCQEDFDEYLKTMQIRGLGGTDFRPVFEYVEQLRKDKEFTNLKGLIYFTDGYGEFPARKPDYDTAFVFIDDEYNNPDVPPWAIKLILQKDEI
jgi:predicted metal-dependent peptidase